MNEFVVRVELKNSMLFDYMKLHKAMKENGFNRTVVADNGVKYHLPNAEYMIETPSSINEVVRVAKACADSTQRVSTVFASQCSQWYSVGLIPVSK